MDKRFILVDDVKMNNLMSRLILGTTYPDAEIIEFNDAQTGLDFILNDYRANAKTHNNVLLLDLYMPGMDGWEFLDVYQNYPDQIKQQIKILILTSSISDEDKAKAKKYSCVSGYLIKPFSAEDIRDVFQ